MNFNILGGTDKYLNWIQTYQNKSKNKHSIKLIKNYNLFLLIAEFDNIRYNYGIICGESLNDLNLFILFGPTYKSYNSEFRANFGTYLEIQDKYNELLNTFNILEKIIHNMVLTQKIQFFTLSLNSAEVFTTYYNVLILSIIINMYTKKIITNNYDSNIDHKFVKLIQYIYDFNSSIMTEPYISFSNISSKIIPIENIETYKEKEFNEINIHKKINALIKYNVVNTFPTFIDWTLIKPITINCFNNELLKNGMLTHNIINYITDNDNKNDNKNEHIGVPSEKNINSYISILYLLENVGNIIYDYSGSIEISNVFELMYSLLALHKYGISYGPTYLSNITYKVNDLYNIDNSVNVYILSEYGEADTYVFKQSKIKCFFIDFCHSSLSEYNNEYRSLIQNLQKLKNTKDVNLLLNSAMYILDNSSQFDEYELFRNLFELYIFNKDHLEKSIYSISKIN